MANLTLIDVIRIARAFSEEAGWGWFRVANIKWDEEEDNWKLTAYLGAFQDETMDFIIDDESEVVLKYESEKIE